MTTQIIRKLVFASLVLVLAFAFSPLPVAVAATETACDICYNTCSLSYNACKLGRNLAKDGSREGKIACCLQFPALCAGGVDNTQNFCNRGEDQCLAFCFGAWYGCLDACGEICENNPGGPCPPDEDGCTTPVVFNDTGVVQLGPGPVWFDIDADGDLDSMAGWTAGGTGFLVLDRNGDGVVNDGSELFGNHTPGSGGTNGYVALAVLDADGDGWVTPAEAPLLLVWKDANADGKTDPGELRLAWDLVVAFGVDYRAGHYVLPYGEYSYWAPLILARNRAGGFPKSVDVRFPHN